MDDSYELATFVFDFKTRIGKLHNYTTHAITEYDMTLGVSLEMVLMSRMVELSNEGWLIIKPDANDEQFVTWMQRKLPEVK